VEFKVHVEVHDRVALSQNSTLETATEAMLEVSVPSDVRTLLMRLEYCVYGARMHETYPFGEVVVACCSSNWGCCN
jgi:hypothetical protein